MQALKRAIATVLPSGNHALAGLLRQEVAAAAVYTSVRDLAACSPCEDRSISSTNGFCAFWNAAPAGAIHGRHMHHHACNASQLSLSGNGRATGHDISANLESAGFKTAQIRRQLSSSASQRASDSGANGTNQSTAAAGTNAAAGADADAATSSAAAKPGAATSGSAFVSTASSSGSPEPLLEPGQPPWTFTGKLRKRKVYTKRMGHMLTVLEDERVKEAMASRNIPDFRPGDSLELKVAIPQNKRRVAIVKGICIEKRNRAMRSSFTIRNQLGTVGPIERTFPLYSPHIQEITVLKRGDVRRAKLFYLRDRQPKEYKVG
mmetsp:Transcript_15891/g.47813  ORF Transcript_15891/g.47813 Transcript_15891/m.47813 type:complete len:320 (-) Transcript_15891:400-1359(-)